MCLPENLKAKEINNKKQQELLQVIEDTRRRMQAETLLAANNIFCLWPGVCLTHSVADLGNNINNNNIVNQRNNNIQQRTRSRSHQRYEQHHRNFSGALFSRQRLQTGNLITRRTNIINNNSHEETLIGNDEYINETTQQEHNDNIVNIYSTDESFEISTQFDEREIDMVPIQTIQQSQQFSVPSQNESIYPAVQQHSTSAENYETLIQQSAVMDSVPHTTDDATTVFNGVSPLLNIFQFFRNI